MLVLLFVSSDLSFCLSLQCMSVAGGIGEEEEEAESLQFVTIPFIYFLLQFVAIPLIYFLLLLLSSLRTLFHLSGKASTQTHSGRVYFWSFLPVFYTSEALHTHGQDRERQNGRLEERTSRPPPLSFTCRPILPSLILLSSPLLPKNYSHAHPSRPKSPKTKQDDTFNRVCQSSPPSSTHPSIPPSPHLRGLRNHNKSLRIFLRSSATHTTPLRDPQTP